MGTDGLVTVSNTKFDYGNWRLILDIPHSAMRYHLQMIPLIQDFWAYPQLGSSPEETKAHQLIQRLRSLPGMTDANHRDLPRSRIIARFASHVTLHTWNNPWGVRHIYLCQQQCCLYAGYVGLFHAKGLLQTIKEIQQSAQ